MARAYGSSATLLLKRETAYRSGSAWRLHPHPLQPLHAGLRAGADRRPGAGPGPAIPMRPCRTRSWTKGRSSVPVDPRYIGLWLTGLLGTPTTTDDGADPATYTHEFVSGKDSLPSYTIEVGHKQVPVYFRHDGVVFDSIALEFTRSGAAAAPSAASRKEKSGSRRTRAGRPRSSTSAASASSRARSAGPAQPSPISPPARSLTPTISRRSRPSARTV